MISELTLDKNLSGLVRLFDDDSPEMQEILQAALIDNALELVLNRSHYRDPLTQLEAEALDLALSRVHNRLVTNCYRQLLLESDGDIDLERSMLVLSYWNRQHVRLADISEGVDRIADNLRSTLPQGGHPSRHLKHISKKLFINGHFCGNSKDYYNPDNSYLDKVLETGLGIPISLSILYMLVCKRLDLPVYGVAMPAHFILKYDDGSAEMFFDPFHDGKLYSRESCVEYLYGFKIEEPDNILNGCTNLDIMRRVFRNLSVAYGSNRLLPDKAYNVEEFLSVLEDA